MNARRDANRKTASRRGAAVGWTSDNRQSSIGDPSGYVAQFWYAPDRSRWKQVSTYSGGTETTIYVGRLLEKLTTGVRTHWKHLIATPSGQVQVIRRSDGSTDVFYVATDALGSTDAVLDAAGTVRARASFGAYGARRSAASWSGAPSPAEWQAIADTTRRGYTGQESLDDVQLVHMNGRVYDPQLGRFLSADPMIDGADGSQGWNRYSYVQGRVPSATDPSGLSKTFTDHPNNNVLPVDVNAVQATDTVTVTASRLYNNMLQWLNVQLWFAGIIRDGDRASSSGGEGGGGGQNSSGQDQKAKKSDPRCDAPLPDHSTVRQNVQQLKQLLSQLSSNPQTADTAYAAVAYLWFDSVRPNGRWDYKWATSGENPDRQGNFNYAATGSLLFSATTLARAAGAVQIVEHALDPGRHPYNPSWGLPWDSMPNVGDDPNDTADILAGVDSCQ